MKNLFSLPMPGPEEQVDILVQGGPVRIEKIVSTGQASGWYNQTETEYVALLQGEATLEYENGRLLLMAAGDTLLIPSGEKHRVAKTSTDPPCVWLCVFYRE